MQPTLRESVTRLLETGIAGCAPHADLADLRASLDHWRGAIAAPMRVALVGRTNSGKSTLMNALLGDTLAPTGNGELTFNVSWFRYGERNLLRVHTIDGAVFEEGFESLDRLTRRCEDNRALLESIRYLEVQCPNPLLRQFDLIDTPGLHSFYVKDSRNTQQLLNDPLTRPHAVVFLFSGSLQEPDVQELERFHQNCGSLMTGLTAIGALTKVDEWPNVFDDGWRVIHQLQAQHPRVRRIFYAILPVIGTAGFGAQTLVGSEQETLQALARLPEARLQKLLRDVSFFCAKEYPAEPAIPPAAQRRELFERLSRYGILRAVEFLNAGGPAADLRAQLMDASNVEKLRTLVTAHFGNRAFLIKARSALAAVRETAFRCAERLRGPAAAVSRRIAGEIDRIVADELRFREFRILERFYAGALPLDESEATQLLDVTGESGLSCARRLGVAESTGLDEQLRIAGSRERAWLGKAYEPFASLEMQDVARVLGESFGDLRLRLERATRDAGEASRLLAYDL